MAGGFHDTWRDGPRERGAGDVSARARRPRPPRRTRHRRSLHAAPERRLSQRGSTARAAAPLAESLLSRSGIAVAAEVIASDLAHASSSTAATAHGLTSTGCMPSTPCWPVVDDGAPAWVRVKHRAVKALARRQERTALRSARTIISQLEHATRRAVIEAGLVDTPSRVHVVYLGSDPSWGSPRQSRARVGTGVTRSRHGDPSSHTSGTLGFDLNKGFDVLWSAWERLARRALDATLLAAGDGGRLPFWRRAAGARRARRARAISRSDVARARSARGRRSAGEPRPLRGLRDERARSALPGRCCDGYAALPGWSSVSTTTSRSLLPPRRHRPNQLTARLRDWSADVEGWRHARGFHCRQTSSPFLGRHGA